LPSAGVTVVWKADWFGLGSVMAMVPLTWRLPAVVTAVSSVTVDAVGVPICAALGTSPANSVPSPRFSKTLPNAAVKDASSFSMTEPVPWLSMISLMSALVR